jgi:transcriptional regulator with XRE-family HTH domain
VQLQTEAIIEALVSARKRQGWSQRDLSERTEMPQSHISKIESGAVDIKLSTLQELARLLDLELVLAPRQALTAVNAALRDMRLDQTAKSVRTLLAEIRAISDRSLLDAPDEPAQQHLDRAVRELAALEIALQTESHLAELHEIRAVLLRGARQGGRAGIRHAAGLVSDLRNRLAHPAPDSQRPAYTLDDED